MMHLQFGDFLWVVEELISALIVNLFLFKLVMRRVDQVRILALRADVPRSTSSAREFSQSLVPDEERNRV